MPYLVQGHLRLLRDLITVEGLVETPYLCVLAIKIMKLGHPYGGNDFSVPKRSLPCLGTLLHSAIVLSDAKKQG